MNKKLFILILFILSILIFFYITSNNQPDNIILNELYTENSLTTENSSSEIVVHIAGSVQNPGIVTLSEGSRIIDVISSAGGATSDADLSKINLAYVVSDAQKIYIPSIYDDSTETNYITNLSGENVIEEKNNSSTININSASQTDLENLPGIGPSTAIKIINYRNENGKFKKTEDLMNVPGIGQSKFNSLKDYISIK